MVNQELARLVRPLHLSCFPEHFRFFVHESEVEELDLVFVGHRLAPWCADCALKNLIFLVQVLQELLGLLKKGLEVTALVHSLQNLALEPDTPK